jgi:hypothetical protein
MLRARSPCLHRLALLHRDPVPAPSLSQLRRRGTCRRGTAMAGARTARRGRRTARAQLGGRRPVAGGGGAVARRARTGRGRSRGPANACPHRPRPQCPPHPRLAGAGRRARGGRRRRTAPAPVPDGVRDRRVLPRRPRVHALPWPQHTPRRRAQLPWLAGAGRRLRDRLDAVATAPRRPGERVCRPVAVRGVPAARTRRSARAHLRRPPRHPGVLRARGPSRPRTRAPRLPAVSGEGNPGGDRRLPDRRPGAGHRRRRARPTAAERTEAQRHGGLGPVRRPRAG